MAPDIRRFSGNARVEQNIQSIIRCIEIVLVLLRTILQVPCSNASREVKYHDGIAALFLTIPPGNTELVLYNEKILYKVIDHIHISLDIT